MTQKERMDAGLLYLCADAECMAGHDDYMVRQNEYNNSNPHDTEKRAKLLKLMFATIGEGCYIEPPFHANWGGINVHFGNNVYANFNLTMVDDANIFVGDNVMFAPNVTLATAGHPIDIELRRQGYQFNKEIHIGNNVWIGAGAIILLGVTIGDNSVIGAGSVVTKDIPQNVLALGNPCKVFREIGKHDKEYYSKNMRIDWENLK